MDKPRIFVQKHDLVATADQTLDAFEANYKVLIDTGIRTSIGNIKVVEITEAGNALVAGPSSISGMKKTIDILNTYNPEKTLIDGAFFRHTLSKISDATVYVVGANFNPEMSKVVEDARLTTQKFELPKAPFETQILTDIGRVSWFDGEDKIKIYEFDSVIGNAEKILDDANKKYRFLYLPKSLPNEFLEFMVANRHLGDYDIIIDSPVALQLNFKNTRNLFKLNKKLYVTNPINLVAVCYNPYSPQGYRFDDAVFEEQLNKALNRRVFNVEKEV
ncbi:MAG TPA: hypothetical protein PK113_02855 [Bacillota bacterium]|nr:hypothetical protein [Bacillota bacterium]